VKTDLTTPGTLAQSQALHKAPAAKDSVAKPLIGKLPVGTAPDYTVELASKAPAPTPMTPVSSLGVPKSPLPDVPKPDLPEVAQEKIKDTAKKDLAKKIEEVAQPEAKEGSLKRPAIIFIKGLDIFSSPSKSEGGYAGVGRLAESVKGSRIYGWDQKTEIIKEIKKTHKDYPVVLVGHSLGGDTAVEIADELDSLKEQFRSIDLLVTLDAIGFSHHIIPQNVKNHLNVFGEKSWFLNDGPHVARREEKTEVRNILSPLDHTDIDDDREIQYEVVGLIQKTLNQSKV
jgi:hypothetical protein